MSICLSLSFLGAKKKKTLHHQSPCNRPFDTIRQDIFLAKKQKNRSTQSLGLEVVHPSLKYFSLYSVYIYSIVHVG